MLSVVLGAPFGFNQILITCKKKLYNIIFPFWGFIYIPGVMGLQLQRVSWKSTFV